MSGPAPITRLLGTIEFEHGPFGLLALEPREYSPAVINQALRARLAKLASHPHGLSTEADEVRLALHVAAAQLRDVAVQREILADLELAPRAPAAEASRSGPLPRPRLAPARTPPRKTAHASMSTFESAALMVLVHSGGWNAESQRRLGSLAHSFGLDRPAFEDAVRNLGRRLRTRTAPLAAGAPYNGREAESDTVFPDDEGDHIARPVHLLRLLLLIGLVVSSAAMVWTINSVRQSTIARRTVPALIDELPLVERSIEMDGLPPSVDSSEPDGPSSLPFPAAPAAQSGAAPDPQSPERQTPLDEIPLWAGPALQMLERSAPSRAFDSLAQSGEVSRINLAAASAFAGQDERSRAALRSLESLAIPDNPGSPQPGTPGADLGVLTNPSGDGDGDLALLFLLARRQPGRYLPELQQIRIGEDPAGPTDCDAIAHAALYGSPTELRAIARRFAERQAGNPAMIYALLEALPHAPRNAQSSAVFEIGGATNLPDARTDDWEARVREALVLRLVSLIGAERFGGVESLAAAIESAWRSQASLRLTGLDSAAHAGKSSARLLWEALLDESRSFSSSAGTEDRIGLIGQQLSMRLAIATGPIQRSGAYQVASAELLAEIIRRERPSQSWKADAVIAEMRERRADAPHSFNQILAVERAALSLWLLRAGVDPGREPTQG